MTDFVFRFINSCMMATLSDYEKN